MARTPSKDSDQPGHPPSLIRVFAVRMKKVWVLRFPFSTQRRLWSDWADAQADLSLRWVHSHFVGFVMRWLISPANTRISKGKKISLLLSIYNFFIIQSIKIISPILTPSMARWCENGRSPRKTTWPSASRTWLVSHVNLAWLKPTAVRWRVI